MASSLSRIALQRSARAFLIPASSSSSPKPSSRRAFSNASLRSPILIVCSNTSLRRRGLASGKAGDKGSADASKSSAESKADASSGSADSPSAPTPIKHKRQAYASLDFAPPEPPSEQDKADGETGGLITDGTLAGAAATAEGQRRAGKTGAKSAKNSMSSIERRRRRMGWLSSFGLVVGLFGGWVWLGWEEGAEDKGVGAWIARSNKNAFKFLDLFDKPIWDKLLPDPLPEGYQRPYTLVLSIDDLLVTSAWDRQHGWRTAKRPGVDYFLSYLSQFYEIVIFTSQSPNTAIPVIEALDPFNFSIMYHLFREATRTYKGGKVVKDLNYLNRDLSKVIAIDTDGERYVVQREEGGENCVEVAKWQAGKKGSGDHSDGDAGLVALIPFLESIAIFNVPDVRPILKKYHGTDVAKEWAQVEADNKARYIKEWEEKQKKAGGLAGGGWTMGKLIGNTPQTQGPPPTFLETRRAEAQKIYKHEQKMLEDNLEELKMQKEKALEEGMKAMQEGGMFGVLSRMGLGPPPAPPGTTSAPASAPTSASASTQTAPSTPTKS